MALFLSDELGGQALTDTEGLDWFSELEGLEDVSGLSLSDSSLGAFFILSFVSEAEAVAARGLMESTQPEFRAESAGRQVLVGPQAGVAEQPGTQATVWQLFLSAEASAEP